MDPEKSILPVESEVDPKPGGAIKWEREKLCANINVPLSACYRDTIYKYCTFLFFFSFLISVGLSVNLLLTLISL